MHTNLPHYCCGKALGLKANAVTPIRKACIISSTAASIHRLIAVSSAEEASLRSRMLQRDSTRSRRCWSSQGQRKFRVGILRRSIPRGPCHARPLRPYRTQVSRSSARLGEYLGSLWRSVESPGACSFTMFDVMRKKGSPSAGFDWYASATAFAKSALAQFARAKVLYLRRARVLSTLMRYLSAR